MCRHREARFLTLYGDLERSLMARLDSLPGHAKKSGSNNGGDWKPAPRTSFTPTSPKPKRQMVVVTREVKTPVEKRTRPVSPRNTEAPAKVGNNAALLPLRKLQGFLLLQ